MGLFGLFSQRYEKGGIRTTTSSQGGKAIHTSFESVKPRIRIYWYTACMSRIEVTLIGVYQFTFICFNDEIIDNVIKRLENMDIK